MNMTKNELTAVVAAILTTLHETGNTGCPESMLYILCGMDMGKWNTVRNVMAPWLSIKGNFVTLTAKGTDMAIQVQNALVKH